MTYSLADGSPQFVQHDEKTPFPCAKSPFLTRFLPPIFRLLKSSILTAPILAGVKLTPPVRYVVSALPFTPVTAPATVSEILLVCS